MTRLYTISVTIKSRKPLLTHIMRISGLVGVVRTELLEAEEKNFDGDTHAGEAARPITLTPFPHSHFNLASPSFPDIFAGEDHRSRKIRCMTRCPAVTDDIHLSPRHLSHSRQILAKFSRPAPTFLTDHEHWAVFRSDTP